MYSKWAVLGFTDPALDTSGSISMTNLSMAGPQGVRFAMALEQQQQIPLHLHETVGLNLGVTSEEQQPEPHTPPYVDELSHTDAASTQQQSEASEHVYRRVVSRVHLENGSAASTVWQLVIQAAYIECAHILDFISPEPNSGL